MPCANGITVNGETKRRRVYRPVFDWDELVKKPYLTRLESAFYLRMSVKAFDNWLASGLIRFSKLGGKILIRRSALDSTIQELERTSAR
jgi:excisionase family DNA binding protein